MFYSLVRRYLNSRKSTKDSKKGKRRGSISMVDAPTNHNTSYCCSSVAEYKSTDVGGEPSGQSCSEQHRAGEQRSHGRVSDQETSDHTGQSRVSVNEASDHKLNKAQRFVECKDCSLKSIERHTYTKEQVRVQQIRERCCRKTGTHGNDINSEGGPQTQTGDIQTSTPQDIATGHTDCPGRGHDTEAHEHEGCSGHDPFTQVEIVTLHKQADTVGLRIIAAKGSVEQDTGIYIQELIPDTTASNDGRLEAGDQLLSIDGISLTGVTEHDAAAMFADTGPSFTLTVVKQGAFKNGVTSIFNKTSPPDVVH